MKLHWRSQILIQGKGSSGKAGLALKIALSPRFNDNGLVFPQDSPRILVVSFLYPLGYYELLKQRIELGLPREIQVIRPRLSYRAEIATYMHEMPRITVIHFSPGFLFAEDLHSKLVRTLEAGRLEGRPYTCVIIDGLHNLALQFPGAGEATNLLPVVYGTLSRANVMTITTFTTLSLSTSEIDSTGDVAQESIFRLRVHLPVLHTLVQASDYVLEVVRADKSRPLPRAEDITKRALEDNAKYLVTVQSAVSRDPPTSPIGWRRQELEFCDPGWGLSEPQQTLPLD